MDKQITTSSSLSDDNDNDDGMAWSTASFVPRSRGGWKSIARVSSGNQSIAGMLKPFPGEPEWIEKTPSQAGMDTRADLWRIAMAADDDLAARSEKILNKLSASHYGWLCLMPAAIGIAMGFGTFFTSEQPGGQGLLLSVLLMMTGGIITDALYGSARTRMGYLSRLQSEIRENPLNRLLVAVRAAKDGGVVVCPELDAVLSLSQSRANSASRQAQLGMDDQVALSALARSLEKSLQNIGDDKTKTELTLSSDNSALVHRVVQTVWDTNLP